MVEQFIKEWEITGEYINTVVSQKGLINLDWIDFVCMAKNHAPISLLNISEENTLPNIVSKGLEILFRNSDISIEGIILVMELPKAGEIMMTELQEISESISERLSDNATMIWGIQENERLSHSLRTVKFFVFGNRKHSKV